nr:reverse transcriptase domain-containing protein [Tanacetum cinerariifolium]
MADQRTMAELLRAPTEGYAEAIVVPPILAEQFELKHSLINMMTSDQFFRIENDTPHDYIRWGSPSVARKEPPRSILTWEDLVSKFINEFFPSSRTTNLRNEISNFQQRSDESFHEAWDRYKDLLRACPHHGFTKLHQCLTTDGNTFSELRDNIQGYVAAVAVNYNQGNSVYRPPGSGSLPSNTIANPKGELKAITTRSRIVLDGPSVNIPPPFINLEEDERVEETLTDQDLAEYTIKVPPPLVQKSKPLSQRDFVVHQRDPLHPNIPYPSRTLKQKQQEKDEVQIHKFWQMFKQLHINITLADALILIPKYQKMLKALLSNKEKLQELANTPLNENCSVVILKKLLEKLGDPGNFSFRVVSMSSKGGNVLPEKLLDLDFTKDLHPPHHVNSLSGSTTYSSSLNQLLEEFADGLALITFPPGNDDLQFDIEFDLKEIEYLLHRDPIKDIDSILKDLIDQSNLANLKDNFDEYDDDLFKVKSDTKKVYDDPFYSKGEKIKESKLLIDEFDLPCDFLLPSEYDAILYEDFSKVDALPSTNNKDKVFNPGILIQENLFEVITHVAPEKKDKKLTISHASLMLEDFDPPFYELPFYKEVPRSKILLPFSSKNKEKVFKPRIHTFEKVHSFLITKLSHQGCKVFKINQILKSPMKIFLFSCGKDSHILDVSCLHFYPLDQLKYRGIGSS